MAMKYVCAYLMCVLGGKEAPTSGDVEKVLKSVGSEVDQEVLKAFMSAVQGKNVDELISKGMGKLQNIPTGGGGAMPTTSTGAASSGGEKGGAAESKKEEKKEEEEEEDDLGFSLFD